MLVFGAENVSVESMDGLAVISRRLVLRSIEPVMLQPTAGASHYLLTGWCSGDSIAVRRQVCSMFCQSWGGHKQRAKAQTMLRPPTVSIRGP